MREEAMLKNESWIHRTKRRCKYQKRYFGLEGRKGKPGVIRGRKVTDPLMRVAELPKLPNFKITVLRDIAEEN
jgi:hypothetical protein